MPNAPHRPCVAPGCPEYAVRNGRCAIHAAGKEHERGTTTERGLGANWRKLRERVLRRHPVCQIELLCGKGAGQPEPALATEVDHIIPRMKRPDLRFVESNLQSACQACNAAKGAREYAA